MNLHINLRIILQVKILRKHIGETIHLTGTKRRISTIVRYVKRTLPDTADRIIHSLQKFTVPILSQSDLISDLISVALRKHIVKENLPRFLRNLSFRGSDLIHCLIRRFHMKYFLLLAFPAHHICRISTFCILYSVNLFYSRHIIIRQAQCPDHFDIHKVLFIIVSIP